MRLVVPSFFVVEVSGALRRLGFDPKGIGRLVDRLTAPPHEVVTVGPRSAKAARSVAIRGKLRGPDALYVWLARREGIPVCALDQEIITRGARFCRLIAPSVSATNQAARRLSKSMKTTVYSPCIAPPQLKGNAELAQS